MTEYQGHRSWNAWNVSLYIANEEHLYRIAVEELRGSYTIAQATSRFFSRTNLLYTKTPDGAVYNTRCVREALAGLEIKQKGESQ